MEESGSVTKTVDGLTYVGHYSANRTVLTVTTSAGGYKQAVLRGGAAAALASMLLGELIREGMADPMPEDS